MAVSRRSIRLCPGVPMARPLGAILHRVGGVAWLTADREALPAGWPKDRRMVVRRRREGPRGGAFPGDHGRLLAHRRPDGPASGRLLLEVQLTKGIAISVDRESTDLSPAWLLVGP